MNTLLKVDKVRCQYDSTPVLHEVSFNLQHGEIGCLLGPSGCGKTTLLRAIAGFQSVSGGEIALGNRTLSSREIMLAPEHRSVGMIFQDYALFPHLTVRENIAFGIRKLQTAACNKLCDELLELVSLEGLGDRYPFELSGGQQQRVAVARALAPQPDMLLMDEPFSSLDVELRKRLALDIRTILKDRGIGALMVTHDQEEAFAVADKVGVLQSGQLQQWDTPFDLYHEPLNRFVADFVGEGEFIPGTIAGPNQVITELGLLEGCHRYDWPEGTLVDVLLRPDDVVHDDSSPYNAEVVNKLFAGTSTRYTLRLPTGHVVESQFPSHHDFEVGDTVTISVQADHLIAFARETADK